MPLDGQTSRYNEDMRMHKQEIQGFQLKLGDSSHAAEILQQKISQMETSIRATGDEKNTLLASLQDKLEQANIDRQDAEFEQMQFKKRRRQSSARLKTKAKRCRLWFRKEQYLGQPSSLHLKPQILDQSTLSFSI